MDLQLLGDKGVEVNSEERSKGAEYLSESVWNISLHFDKQSNCCCYSSHIVNLSLTIYLHNTSSYNQVRKSGLITLSYPSTLKTITRRIE